MLPSLEASKPRSLEVPRRESRSEINYSSVCPYIDNQDDEDAEDEYASLTSRLMMMMSYDR